MARVSESGIKDIFTFIDAGDNRRLQVFLSERSGAANARNLQNVSAIMYALYRRNHDAVRMLRDKLMSLDIWEASALGDDRQLRAILQPGADVDAFSPDGYTPLQLASFFGRPDTVVLLLKAGADPDLLSANPAKTSALHGAATAGYLEVVLRLIEGGADVNLKAGTGFTPLDAALKKGDKEIIDFISEATSKTRPPKTKRTEHKPDLASVTIPDILIVPEPLPVATASAFDEAKPEPIVALKPAKATMKATVGATIGAKIGTVASAEPAAANEKTATPPGTRASSKIGTKMGTKIGGKPGAATTATEGAAATEPQPKRTSLSTTFRSTRKST